MPLPRSVVGDARARRRDPLTILLSVVVVGSFLVPPTLFESAPTICVVQRFVGVPCPGCGLSRAFVSMAHGRFAEAAAHHVFGPALFLAAGVVLVRSVVRRRAPGVRRHQGPWRTVTWAALGVVWLAWAVERILTAA